MFNSKDKDDFGFLCGGFADLNGDGKVDLAEFLIEKDIYDDVMKPKSSSSDCEYIDDDEIDDDDEFDDEDDGVDENDELDDDDEIDDDDELDDDDEDF